MNDDMKQCENQVMLFFRYLDECKYDALVALLAPDARWHRQGKVLEGPAQVHAALKQRSPTMKIAHVITNLASDEYDAQRCSIQAYMLVVRHEPGRQVAGPVPLNGIESIRRLQIGMVQHAGHWMIARLNAEDTIFAANA